MKYHDATEIAFKNGYEKGASNTAREIIKKINDWYFHEIEGGRTLRELLTELEKEYLEGEV